MFAPDTSSTLARGTGFVPGIAFDVEENETGATAVGTSHITFVGDGSGSSEGGSTSTSDSSTAGYLSASMIFYISTNGGPPATFPDGCTSVVSTSCSWSYDLDPVCNVEYFVGSEFTDHYVRWIVATDEKYTASDTKCGVAPVPDDGDLFYDDGNGGGWYGCDFGTDSFYYWSGDDWVLDGEYAVVVCEDRMY